MKRILSLLYYSISNRVLAICTCLIFFITAIISPSGFLHMLESLHINKGKKNEEI